MVPVSLNKEEHRGLVKDVRTSSLRRLVVRLPCTRGYGIVLRFGSRRVREKLEHV